jgi:hypothetical protein
MRSTIYSVGHENAYCPLVPRLGPLRPEHPDVTSCIEDIGDVLCAKGRYSVYLLY